MPGDDTTTAPAPAGAPALYPCEIVHVRTAPLRHALRHRTYLWLIDPDRPPVLPRALRPLARFEARDHFGGAQPTIRAGLDAFLAGHGVDLGGGPVRMLTHARVLGHVFNPLTVYWCHDPDGTPRCVVAEVHNTYGGHHSYLLLPDDRGRADTDKEFYVSPFFPVDGRYRMRVPAPADRLDLTVHLEREGGRPFTATVRGARRDARPAALLRLALRRPWSTLAVSAAIRWHGIRLYLRGLPVQPRPAAHADPARGDSAPGGPAHGERAHPADGRSAPERRATDGRTATRTEEASPAADAARASADPNPATHRRPDDRRTPENTP